mmetsp:Transcript_14275/g.22651  ORF Transcript_14275/g.22651 Transcript_14275/m.22651 type:complete len:227 (-) Transcript_14275:2218-2898(-)
MGGPPLELGGTLGDSLPGEDSLETVDESSGRMLFFPSVTGDGVSDGGSAGGVAADIDRVGRAGGLGRSLSCLPLSCLSTVRSSPLAEVGSLLFSPWRSDTERELSTLARSCSPLGVLASPPLCQKSVVPCVNNSMSFLVSIASVAFCIWVNVARAPSNDARLTLRYACIDVLNCSILCILSFLIVFTILGIRASYAARTVLKSVAASTLPNEAFSMLACAVTTRVS